MGGQCALLADAQVDWLCADIKVRRQTANGCVPACMAMLLDYLGWDNIDAAALARAWTQGPNEEFLAPAMYTQLREFSVVHGLSIDLEYTGRRHTANWHWLSALGRPTLLAFDGHAQICVGTCSGVLYRDEIIAGYCVLDPATGGKGWFGFPQAGFLSLDFALSAPLTSPFDERGDRLPVFAPAT